ncbi:MAG: VOC family protein [Shimia sp.]|uniref:VOC family protein n=1 Tax=Shimia sp. TaxID=1954381 RepID=UPI004058F0D2
MRLKQITPFVPCSNLGRQSAFYQDVLGFEVGFLAENYAFLRRDAGAIRLVEVSADVDLSAPERESSFYIDVDDTDAVYAEMAPRLAALDQARVRPPFDQPYRHREFHLADEDCTLAFFGEGIAD